MTTTVLFCFKGRHGLGHTRRTLLIAEALARIAPAVRVVLMSQGRPIELLRRTPLPAVNLPVLERLPNDAMEAAYLDLLRALGARLAPSLLVEDTYPDPRHLFLAPFRDVPKALVMSGMTRGAYLERLRQDGLLRHYDRILVAREETALLQSAELTRATRTMLRHSGRVRFHAPVFALPEATGVAAAAARFSPDGLPLVVVSAGAGGDVTTQAFPERLFSSMTEVAARLLEDGVRVRVVLVAGPYYRGSPPAELPNVTYVPFVPQLPALLHAARVAVIRPGSNVLRETLSGPAATVLVPNFSWAEDQRATAELVARSLPQVGLAACDDVATLYQLTRAGLAAPPRPPWPEARRPAPERLAEGLLDLLEPPPPGPDAFLIISAGTTSERRKIAERELPGVPHTHDDPRLLLLDRVPPVHASPATLYERGVRLVLAPQGEAHNPRHGVNYDPGYGFDLPVWRNAYRPAEYGLAGADVHHVRATPGNPGAFGYRLARARRLACLPAIWLDLGDVPDDLLPGHLQAVAAVTGGVRLASVTELLAHHVTAQLM
ncbi:hypothetical protein ACIBKY_46220 [Nonomuraea sp. NPDC050394]|uniref:hypothetical protein n=1 Tax=Nonomuraea sp. NPDC050394 TaxID=3364363 RepID=UPI0037BDEE4B